MRKLSIVFIDSKGNIINNTNDDYFIMNDKVFKDNYYSTESQEASVCFDDFIEECADVTWTVVEETATGHISL